MKNKYKNGFRLKRSHGTIYYIPCPETGKIMYIGATTLPLQIRLTNHLSAAKKKKTKMAIWLSEMIEKGYLEHIRIIEIEGNVPFDNLHTKEVNLIKANTPPLNTNNNKPI